jgi:hypothetical protein
MDVGYSGTPLWKKLGLKPGLTAQLVGAPTGWSVSDEPAGVEWVDESHPAADLVVTFIRSAAEVSPLLETLGERVYPAGMVWVAWPRKAAGHVSDVDESLIRDTALGLGLVDVKVAAIDSDWSGLKLVWRKTNRTR